MADVLVLDARLSPEGRVVIPVEIRQVLDVRGGDRIRFIVEDDGQVRVVTPRLLAVALWANNHGGEAGNSVADVRASRDSDAQIAAEGSKRVAAHVAADDGRSESDVTAELVAAVGLDR